MKKFELLQGTPSLIALLLLGVPGVSAANEGSLVDEGDAAQQAIEAAQEAAAAEEAAKAAAEEAAKAAEEAGDAAEQAADAAEAAADAAADATATEEPAEEKQGWEAALSVGANAAATYVKDVVGASADGTTYQLGIVVAGTADWTHGQHSIANELNIQHTRTRTPQLDLFVKSADLIQLNSTYLYSLDGVPWLGPFARFKLTSALFPGYEVYADPALVTPTTLDTVPGDDVVPDDDPPDGTSEVAPLQKIPLTGAFEPLVMRQSVGMFANPVSKSVIKIKTKLGAGVQETLTRGGYINADDEATPDIIEYSQLEDSTQAGAELSLDFTGTLRENLNWSAGAGFFLPLITSNPEAPAGVEGLNSDLSLNIALKLNKWASLDYAFSARKVPSVSPDWQVQTGVMLTASFNVIE